MSTPDRTLLEGPVRMTFDSQELADKDSGLLTFLLTLHALRRAATAALGHRLHYSTHFYLRLRLSIVLPFPAYSGVYPSPQTVVLAAVMPFELLRGASSLHLVLLA